MKESLEILIEGEMTRSEAEHAVRLFSDRYKASMKIGKLTAERGAGPDYSLIVAIGRLIAAIASFTLDVLSYKRRTEAGKANLWHERLTLFLKEFAIADFHVVEVKNADGLLSSPPRRCRITLLDRRTGERVTVTVSAAGTINLKRESQILSLNANAETDERKH